MADHVEQRGNECSRFGVADSVIVIAELLGVAQRGAHSVSTEAHWRVVSVDTAEP